MGKYINDIADGVAEKLSHLSAKVCYTPEFDLEDLKEQVCVVIPVSAESQKPCRNLNVQRCTFNIEVGLLYRSKDLPKEKLTKMAEDIASSFIHVKINGATCISSVPKPLYDVDHLRQNNQFSSVITLTFVGVYNE